MGWWWPNLWRPFLFKACVNIEGSSIAHDSLFWLYNSATLLNYMSPSIKLMLTFLCLATLNVLWCGLSAFPTAERMKCDFNDLTVRRAVRVLGGDGRLQRVHRNMQGDTLTSVWIAWIPQIDPPLNFKHSTHSWWMRRRQRGCGRDAARMDPRLTLWPLKLREFQSRVQVCFCSSCSHLVQITLVAKRFGKYSVYYHRRPRKWANTNIWLAGNTEFWGMFVKSLLTLFDKSSAAARTWC